MRIGIFARDDDAQADHLQVVARARNHEVLRLDFARMLEGGPVTFDGASWQVGGAAVDSCHGFVLHKLPAVGAQLGPPDDVDTAAGWWRRGMLQKERAAFAHACVMAMELRGLPVVNRLARCQPFDHKPLQLEVFAKAGLPVPRTLVTSSKAWAAAFRREVGEVVAKPAAGGAATRLLDDEALASLDDVMPSPIIFQERVRGADVRVTVVGGKVVSSVATSSDDVDHRQGAAWRAGEVVYAPHPLPAAAAATCIAAASLCHHALSGVDLKHTGGEGYVLLEANSAPVYLDIERQTGAPIARSVVEHLERAVRG